LTALSFRSYAQDREDARIYFAEGGEFILSAGEQRTSYGPGSLGDGGFILHTGDIIQTGPGSFVEIHLGLGGKVIRIAENTFLSYNRTSDEGVSLELSYGRLRLSDDKNGSPGAGVFIQSGTAEVVFHTGDISVDYTIRPLGENSRQAPVLRVSVFSGAAEFIPLIRASRVDYPGIVPEIPRFHIAGPEEAAVEIAPSLSYVERKPLSKEIIAYWDHYASAVFLPPSPALEELSLGAASLSETRAQIPDGQNGNMFSDYNLFIKKNTVKNSFIVAGLSLSLVGAVLETLAYSEWNLGDQRNRDISAYTGHGFLGLGILSFGAALFINPKLPVSDAPK
jgi:hypothetical protein